MSHSIQVLYPVTETTNFDYDYYFGTHMNIVGKTIGEHIKSTLVTKGIAGGPNVPAGYHAIATILFEDKAALDAALSKMGPAIDDIANFTNSKPTTLIGEVVG